MNAPATGRAPSPLGTYLKSKRKAAGLSQDTLAEKVGTTQGGISNWEAGGVMPSAKALAALARHLPGADVDEMLALLEGDERS